MSRRVFVAAAPLGYVGMMLARLHGVSGPACRKSRPGVWLVVLAAGCGSGGHRTAPSASGSALPISASASGRAAWVAEADRLAVSVDEGRSLANAVAAARLRTRSWRLYGKRVDALEAVELLSTASRGSWPGACDAALTRGLLEAELRNDPSEAYRAAYKVRAASKVAACVKSAKRILAVLATYRPPPEVLDALTRSEPASAAPNASALAAGKVVVPTLNASRTAGPARIQAIEPYGARESARVVVRLDKPALYQVGTLGAASGRGPRLFVDVPQGKYSGKMRFDVGGLLQRVRVGKRASGTRVVLDLSRAAYRNVFFLPEPFRLVIDVSTQPPKQTHAQGRRMVRRVVLDPGHGGHDPGAVGVFGLREKDVTLDVAHRAAPLIARELGISTLLTRDSDTYVSLAERTARANAFSADLFVSIHCNASESSDAHGVMTFVLDSAKDPLGSRVAARENDASVQASEELARALGNALGGHRAASTHFAALLQRSTMASVGSRYRGLRDQGVKSAGFYVLAGAHMPAVLYEVSFISNITEEQRLDTADYRQKLADAIVNAIKAYRGGL